MILREFQLTNSEVWFFKMDVCIPLGLIALGNSRGKVSERVYVFCGGACVSGAMCMN